MAKSELDNMIEGGWTKRRILKTLKNDMKMHLEFLRDPKTSDGQVKVSIKEIKNIRSELRKVI